MKKERIMTIFLFGTLIFYVYLLADIILFKYVSPINLFSSSRMYYNRNINVIPFDMIRDYFSGEISRSAVFINVLGNIALFIPMGIYFVLFKKISESLQIFFWFFP